MSDKKPSDFGAILEAFERETRGSGRRDVPKPGEWISGRVIGFGEETAFVDLGGKSEGAIPLVDVTDEGGERTVAVGDTVEAMVVAVEDDTGTILLRLHPGEGPAAQAELAQAHQLGIPVEGTVQAVIKGGVEVNVGGIRGFCPISQLDTRFVQDASEFVGRKLPFRITRFEEGRRGAPNVVLSRRALLEEEARARAAETRANLAVGKTVRGTVTSLTSYGAFVDLGGLEGLLHVSELGHGRVEHPQDVLAPGQEIDVQITRIEPGKDGSERISLSRKALLDDPWDEQAARLSLGTRRRGRVVRLQPFGAFVELAPGVDGLLHVSELAAERPIQHPREAVSVGDEVDVRVLSVDVERRRIALALDRGDAGEAPEVPRETAGEGGLGTLGDFFERAKRRD